MSINIYGASCGHHDAALSLINDRGNILFASHAERYSYEKFDKWLNPQIVSNAKIYADVMDSDKLCFYEKTFSKLMREISSFDFRSWSERDPCDDLIALELAPSKYGIFDYPHHKSHAAAGFQTSPFDEAVVVVIDAIGEWDTATIWKAHYDENGYAKYKKMWRMKYPKSIGLLYSAFTKYVDLKPLEEEYILMGMAAYGRPLYARDIWKYYVDGKGKAHRGVENFIANMIDKKRIRSEWEIEDVDIAASIQEVTEDWVLSIMHKARKYSENLVFMGGVALNCVLNTEIADINIFKDIWIMPNPGDAGSSLGAAALWYGKKLNWQNPMLGYDIEGEYPVDDIINELLTNKIVGVANGRAEFGPRALGNRSLLADPRGKDIKDKVNEIKKRQKFRPFSPAILEEEMINYFEMPRGVKKSPYMQYIGWARHPSLFPAVVHCDNSARIQSVSEQDNPGFRKLLEVWYEKTGCPMLLNTSLNIRGEPMVNIRQDAKRFEKTYGVKVCT